MTHDIAEAKRHQGFRHGMATTRADTNNSDLLAFVQS